MVVLEYSWRAGNARIPAPPGGFAPHPPTPFSHKGRRGSLGILMPETGDGMQGLPQKPAPVRTPPLPRACPLTEIHFGRPMPSPNPCRNNEH